MDIKKQSTIFVRNFQAKLNNKQASDAGEASLRELFGRFGLIEQVFILQTPNQDLIGYIEFKDKKSAVEAITTMDLKSLSNGKCLKVGLVKKCNDSINNLYIKNLPEIVDENVLESLFKKFGKIVSATIMKDDDGNSRGFGFVCFENEIHAAIAKKDMNGFEIGGKKFDISFAQKKENREAYLTAQKKGKLKQEEVVQKPKRLPLELRAVRRPTKEELALYASVPCLQQIEPYGHFAELSPRREISNSMMRMPTMTPMQRSYDIFGMNWYLSQNFNYNNNRQKSLQKPQSKTLRPYASTGNEGKSNNCTKNEKSEAKNITQAPLQNEKSETKDSKEVLKELILPQLKKAYPPYANTIMDRLMERQYKDLLRLSGNYRLLQKVANSEVQKIKAQANASKRS